MLFATYHEILRPVRDVIARRYPQRDGESDAAFDRRVRSEYVDVCRFLLPAASLANVGVTVNARTLEHALRKMLSHPLEEVRQMGEEMKKVSKARLPTLIKYVERVPYWEAAAKRLSAAAEAVKWEPPKKAIGAGWSIMTAAGKRRCWRRRCTALARSVLSERCKLCVTLGLRAAGNWWRRFSRGGANMTCPCARWSTQALPLM